MTSEMTDEEYELLVARYTIAERTGYTMRNGYAWAPCATEEDPRPTSG